MVIRTTSKGTLQFLPHFSDVSDSLEVVQKKQKKAFFFLHTVDLRTRDNTYLQVLNNIILSTCNYCNPDQCPL